MKKTTLLSLLFFTAYSIFAQDPEKIKKLEQDLLRSATDSSKAVTLTKLSKEYGAGDPKNALLTARKSIAIAKKNKSELLLADCYYYFANGFLLTGKSDSAVYYLELEKKIREEKKDSTGLAYCIRKTADCYSQQGQHVLAVKYYLQALRIWEAKKDFWNCANVYVDLGNVSYYQKKIGKAQEYYASASDMFLKGKDSISANILLINSATIYLEQNNTQKSKELFEKISEKLILAYPQPDVAHGYYINLAMLYTKLKDFGRAEIMLGKALKYYSDSANSVIKLNQGSGAAEFYVRTNNFKSGLEWAEKLVKHAKEIGSLEYEKIGLSFMAKSNAGLKNYEAAYKNFLAYDEIKDSLLSDENRKLVAEMEGEFQSAKKELENKSLKAEAKVKDAEIATVINEKKRQHILIIAFACVLLLVVAFLYFVFRNLQLNKKKNRIITEQKAEVDRAYAQLNEKNKEVLDSIHYAKRIQMALMSTEKNIERKLNSVRKKTDS